MSAGNPIHAGVGNKFQQESDYVGGGPFPLSFVRTYNSFGSEPGNLMKVSNGPLPSAAGWGESFSPLIFPPPANAYTKVIRGATSNSKLDRGWRHNYDRAIRTTSSLVLTTASVIREDSKIVTFTLVNDAWVADTAAFTTTLSQQKDGNGLLAGWQFANERDELETYDAEGRLLTIENRLGLRQTLQYDGQGRLASVTDPVARSITFGYNTAGQIDSLMDPASQTYKFDYDGNGNLVKVTYPDGYSRQYVYDDVRFRYALTGIIDENNKRFATWKYDAVGNAISSEHAGGADKVDLDFAKESSTSSTFPNGLVRAHHLNVVNGVARASYVVERFGASSLRVREFTYTPNGNVKTATDWSGTRTDYTYDTARNLETRRVEAADSTVARTITTEWHPTFRLPTRIAEPKRVTQFVYDTLGNLTSKTVRTTSDGNGAAGFGAAVTGVASVWGYTYNGFGQVLSSTGPRADIAQTVTRAYDAHGNLTGISNALSQQTTLSDYDINGRPGLITDPNGLTTRLAYSPRGWLLSRTVGGEVTRYDYDGVGQLIKVTRADGQFVGFTYDDAHRPTGVSDNVGNSITYLLDATGNRTGEVVRDAAGTLARQTTRIFDLLGRVKEITGAQP